MSRVVRPFLLTLGLLLCVVHLSVQSASAQQTPRQALIEMFFSTTQGTFIKHLPELTRTTLEKAGALDNMKQYSAFISQIHTEGTTIETFDTGSVLLKTKNLKTLEEFEVRVEHEGIRDGQDDVEVSFHVIKNGKEEPTAVKPRLTFSMKQESQVWRLNEVAFALRVPLADPELLKALTEKMKAQPGAPHVTLAAQNGIPSQSGMPAPPQPSMPVQTAVSDSQITGAMKTILTAEVTYFATYPNVGYTCTLSDLDGFGGGEPNEHQAMLINSGLASGKKYGYIFQLSGCNSRPATSFRLTAVPNANNFSRKTFCTDQSAAIRTSDDGNPATCAASGTPAQ
jgi:hypothetical protein